MKTIKDGLVAAKDIGFLEGYNRAIMDVLKETDDAKAAISIYKNMMEKLSVYYQEKMGEPMPGAKK